MGITRPAGRRRGGGPPAADRPAPAGASGWYYVAVYTSPKSGLAWEDCLGTPVDYTLSLSQQPRYGLFIAVVRQP